MSAEEKTTSNINCTDADSNSTKCKEVDDEVIQQFKIIMVVVLIVLVVFLGFFVYNLPKWRAKLNEEPRVTNIESSVKEPTQTEFSSTASA